MSFARKFGDKYGNKLMDTATKTGIDAAKRLVQKTAETAGDLTGNKIADKNTWLGKTKSKEKEKEEQEIYMPPEKRQQTIEKITNLLGTTIDKIPRFITKKWVEVHDQSSSSNDSINQTNK